MHGANVTLAKETHAKLTLPRSLTVPASPDAALAPLAGFSDPSGDRLAPKNGKRFRWIEAGTSTRSEL
jgi:hypothetical protein